MVGAGEPCVAPVVCGDGRAAVRVQVTCNNGIQHGYEGNSVAYAPE